MQKGIFDLLILIGIATVGCSTSPQSKALSPSDYSAKDLLALTCRPGDQVQSIKGSIYLKLKGKDLSGQFPANVNVTDPENLEIEITNPLGGSEALIHVTPQSYTVVRQKEGEEKKHVETATWGGIPLAWAIDLFLGRIPCPSLDPKAVLSSKISIDPTGKLSVLLEKRNGEGHQKFIYSYEEHQGHPWPSALHWEQDGAQAAQVDFEFGSPEKKTLSPQKWEAKSAENFLKVRWRTR